MSDDGGGGCDSGGGGSSDFGGGCDSGGGGHSSSHSGGCHTSGHTTHSTDWAADGTSVDPGGVHATGMTSFGMLDDSCYDGERAKGNASTGMSACRVCLAVVVIFAAAVAIIIFVLTRVS